MLFKDIIDSGFQPSRWYLGWRRFLLVRSIKNRTLTRSSVAYEKYLQTLVEVIGAQLNADSNFLLTDPESRLKNITRLIERTLNAENQLRKELIDAYLRAIYTKRNAKNLKNHLYELYITAAKSYLDSKVKVQKYPLIQKDQVEEALLTQHRNSIEQIIKSIIEPEIIKELQSFKHKSRNQLLLELNYKS